ncbi:MAG: hypothetical protein QGI83_20645 [Candidatus Latescibacteria bacterium]|jgi:carbamoyl-phosphate synthase large subunit|nr:hypothetical protein [Candidatus Latescibacterota bacterium]
MSDNSGLAFYRAHEAAKQQLPVEGTVLVSVAERDRPGGLLEAARRFTELGFKLRATKGIRSYLTEHSIEAELIMKIHEGRPNIADAIKNGETQLVVNAPIGKLGNVDDSYIRKAAIQNGVPYITTTAAAIAAAKGIAAQRQGKGETKSLQAYHSDIV